MNKVYENCQICGKKLFKSAEKKYGFCKNKPCVIERIKIKYDVFQGKSAPKSKFLEYVKEQKKWNKLQKITKHN